MRSLLKVQLELVHQSSSVAPGEVEAVELEVSQDLLVVDEPVLVRVKRACLLQALGMDPLICSLDLHDCSLRGSCGRDIARRKTRKISGEDGDREV